MIRKPYPSCKHCRQRAAGLPGDDVGEAVQRGLTGCAAHLQAAADGILARIELSAGKGDLAGMTPDRVGAHRQDHRRFGSVDDGYEHGGRGDAPMRPDERIVRIALDQDGRTPMAEVQRLAQGLGEAHRPASIAKNAPPLHRPGGWPPSASTSSASS